MADLPAHGGCQLQDRGVSAGGLRQVRSPSQSGSRLTFVARYGFHLINQAAIGVNDVVICPDADLGGVRIAARIHDHLPPDTHRVIVDIGTGEHDQGDLFSTMTRDRIATRAERTDAVGAFARSCLARGYAVEQQAPARATLQPLL